MNSWIVLCFSLWFSAAEILNTKEAKKRLKSPRQRAEASAMPRHCAEGWLLEALRPCLNANCYLTCIKKESVAEKYIFQLCELVDFWASEEDQQKPLTIPGDLLLFCLCEAISAR